MLRLILIVGLVAASGSAVLLAVAPLEAPTPVEPAANAKPQLLLLGVRETVADLRPAVVTGPTPQGQLVPPRPALAESPGAISDPVTPGPVRNVTPEGMTAGPAITAALVRAEPAASAGSEPPLPARNERLFNPVITSAGVLKVREREIRLAGIDAPHFQERCGEGAATWPCGRMARSALRRFIRGRAIECAVPAGAEAIPDPAACSVAGVNLAEWLVAQGWGRQANVDYAELEKRAREKKIGLWADVRPDVQPAELAVRAVPSAPDNAASMRARLSGTP